MATLNMLEFIMLYCYDLLGVGLILPQIANEAQNLGCSHLVIGSMSAVYSASQLVSGPMIGSLSDIKGRKPILLFSLTVTGVAYLLLGFASSITLFFLTRFFLGIFKQTQLLTKSIAPDHVADPGQHSAIFGKMATFSGMGMSLGPLASGHIVEAYPDSGFKIISVLVFGIFAINAFLIKLLPNKKTTVNKPSKSKSEPKNDAAVILIGSIKKNLQDSVRELKKVNWDVYWDVFLFKLIITLSIGMYFTNYSIFLKTVHQVSPKYLGYIIAFQGGLGSLCTYFNDYISKQFYKDDKDATERTFHIFIALTASFVAMGLSPNIYFYIIFVIPLAISGAVGRVASLEMIMRKGQDEHRGSVIGATGSIRSLAGVVTPLMAGAISEYIGVPYVLFFAALFSASGIFLSYKIRTQSQTKSDKKNE